MLPINSRFSNQFVTNFYYRAIKRCLLGQRQLSSSTKNAADIKSYEPVEEPLQLASTYYFNQFPNYCQMVTDAKSRAKRSIIIDHCGFDHIDLKLEFKNIEHVYSIEKETIRGVTKFSLIEFKSENDAESIARRARHNEGLLPVPLKIFRYLGQACPNPAHGQNLPFPVDNVKLSYRREISTKSNSYSELISNNMMSLVALKMRFITLVNFERILCSGMFQEYELMPFGSSVIDLGCDSGDLDLCVTRTTDHSEVIKAALLDPQNLNQSSEPSLTKLVHLDKSLYSESDELGGIRCAMRWFDHILREYMPLTDGHAVQFIHRAKVPIIKFMSRITAIDCDLSFNLGLDHRERDIMTTNYSGILMSQILYSLCRSNNLFTAAAVYLKIFGKLTYITSKGSGTGFTNFQYLSLVLFYLQQVGMVPSAPGKRIGSNPPIVPSFKELLKSETGQSINLESDQIDRLLPRVLIGFFEFYSNFDFHNKSLNLYKAKVERKMDNSTIYVQNPLDRSSNICHNVNKRGLDNFVKHVKAAKGECPMVLIKNLLLKQRKFFPRSNERRAESLSEMFNNDNN